MNLAKRIFDLVFVLPGLVLLFPLFIIIALLIYFEDRGTVFFFQKRVGLKGKQFRMFKFRTMVMNAESVGMQLTVGKDPRITRIGRFLRESKIDELPQLVNVLRGEMSLVGPRPEVARYVALYNLEQKTVLDLIPGITDPASVRYKNESAILAESTNPETTYIKEIMPDKILINLKYAKTATIVTDCLVIFSTLKRLF